MAKLTFQDAERIHLDLTNPLQRPAIDAFTALIRAVPALTTRHGQIQAGGRTCIYICLASSPHHKPVLNGTMHASGRAQLEFRRSQFLDDELRARTVEQSGASRYVPFDPHDWQRWVPIVTAYAARIDAAVLQRSSGHQLMARILDRFQPGEWLDEARPRNVQLPFKGRLDFYNATRGWVIEVDGAQHHAPIERMGGLEGFQEIQRRDALKDAAVIGAGLRMIRVKAYGRRAALTSLSPAAFWALLNERLEQGDPSEPILIEDAP